MKTIWLLITAAVLLQALPSCSNGKNMKNADNNATIEAILARKSVRTYKALPVEQEKVELLLRAGMAAPSAKNLRPWEFIVVNDRDRLDRMAESLPYAKMLAHSPLAIIVCGDAEAAALWYLDCSAAAQNILLAAEALGLGAVWTAAYPYQDRIDAVSSTLGLPADIQPLCVIPVGYPEGEHKAKDKFDPAKIRYNGW